VQENIDSFAVEGNVAHLDKVMAAAKWDGVRCIRLALYQIGRLHLRGRTRVTPPLQLCTTRTKYI
jgi:hypothetical protein